MSYQDERAVSKSEFANMLLSWDIEEDNAEKAYDFITEHGKKKMDCKSIEIKILIIKSLFFFR